MRECAIGVLAALMAIFVAPWPSAWAQSHAERVKQLRPEFPLPPLSPQEKARQIEHVVQMDLAPDYRDLSPQCSTLVEQLRGYESEDYREPALPVIHPEIVAQSWEDPRIQDLVGHCGPDYHPHAYYQCQSKSCFDTGLDRIEARANLTFWKLPGAAGEEGWYMFHGEGWTQMTTNSEALGSIRYWRVPRAVLTHPNSCRVEQTYITTRRVGHDSRNQDQRPLLSLNALIELEGGTYWARINGPPMYKLAQTGARMMITPVIPPDLPRPEPDTGCSLEFHGPLVSPPDRKE